MAPAQVLVSLPQNAKAGVIRRTAQFRPSIWGDQFDTYTSLDVISHAYKQQEVEELKEVVRMELMTTAHHPSQQLKFIDAIQRLGMAYHYEEEIEEALQHIFDSYDISCEDNDDEDLFSVALWFRLLRQGGHNVSSNVFGKFKNEKGNFKESLVGDTRGMLCLYEAAHLGVHGEFGLDEALDFTTIHLQAMVKTNAGNPLTPQVIHALKQPSHRGLARVEARHYISAYQEDLSHNKALLKLAKLDFNLLQNTHRMELRGITRWWKELDFATKLPFARDRVVESYFWASGAYFEPQYSLARKILTKLIALLTVMDDIYDAYGTLEELELFDHVIKRWDINSTGQLPGYIKLFFQAVIDFYEEVEKEMAKAGRMYRVHYFIEAMQNVARGYMVETKWLNQKYIPTLEEYMYNARLFTGYPMLITTSFLGMGEMVTKAAFDWVVSDPKIIEASSIIGRLMNDMASHKFEQERGHVASSIECYMKQHGVSEKQVYDELQKQVVSAWKDLNQECLTPTGHVPTPLLKIVLNLARVMDVIYKREEDALTHGGKEMKDGVALLFINPVPI